MGVTLALLVKEHSQVANELIPKLLKKTSKKGLVYFILKQENETS
jgi:hypothetical protein